MLKILFLGTPIVMLNDTPLTELCQSPVVLRLFAFLVTHRQRPHQRSLLAGTFWPELAEDRARRNLNNVLWRLRSLLTEASDLLLIDKQMIQFNPQGAYWLDVAEFDQHTRALSQLAAERQQTGPLTTACLKEFEEALALYRGDFLPALDDDWCTAERGHWHECYLNILERFAEFCKGAGNLVRALQIARQLAIADPYREGVHEQLIELYIALNRPGEARTQFEQYEQVWRTELKLSPSVPMLALAQRHGWRSAVVAPPIIPPLAAELSVCVQDHPAYLRRQL
jgi:DNA-binding SARP family transcriptional activator